MKPPRAEVTTTSTSPSPWPLQVLAIGLFLLCITYHLGMAARGFSAYRGQHLGAALEYAKGRIDLLRPVIVGFNANGAPTAYEFPIWQAAAAVFFKLFGLWFGWANLTSLLFMLAGGWPLFQIARLYLGVRGAWWTLVFFIAQPLVFFEAGRGGNNGCCCTFAVWFVFFGERLVRTGQIGWTIPAALFGALSAVTNASFFFCAGLAVFFMLVVQHAKSPRRWILLAAVGLFAAGVFAAWTHYTSQLAAQAEFSFVDLRLSGKTEGTSMVSLYFGDLRYRLNPAMWVKGAWHFFNGEFGSYVLLALPIIGFFGLRRGLAHFWIAAAAATTLVFTNLVLQHYKYYLMFSPALALLCAAAMEPLEEHLFSGTWEKWRTCAIFGTGVLLGLAVLQGFMGMKVVLETDPYPEHIAQLIRQYTSPNDKLLIEGGGLGGDELFLSDRRGLSIWSTQFLEQPQNLKRIQSLGFTRLVMISESPLLTAVQQSNPGGANISRRSYHPFLTPVAQGWKTLVENDDLLIRVIPPG